jgi:hypothetical protein
MLTLFQVEGCDSWCRPPTFTLTPNYSWRFEDSVSPFLVLRTMTKFHWQRNILINGSGRAQLCDFGLVKILTDVSTGLTTTSPYAGTERYLSRELLVGGDDVSPSAASDVYALGCIGLEVRLMKPKPYCPSQTRLAAHPLTNSLLITQKQFSRGYICRYKGGTTPGSSPHGPLSGPPTCLGANGTMLGFGPFEKTAGIISSFRASELETRH